MGSMGGIPQGKDKKALAAKKEKEKELKEEKDREGAGWAPCLVVLDMVYDAVDAVDVGVLGGGLLVSSYYLCKVQCLDVILWAHIGASSSQATSFPSFWRIEGQRRTSLCMIRTGISEYHNFASG